MMMIIRNPDVAVQYICLTTFSSALWQWILPSVHGWFHHQAMKYVAWSADQIFTGSMLIKYIGSRECVPQASHTQAMARCIRLLVVAGSSAINNKSTYDEEEIKKQEIKNLKTISINENGEH